MKCIKSVTTGNITRVSNIQAKMFVERNVVVYVSKAEWKTAGRKRGIKSMLSNNDDI